MSASRSEYERLIDRYARLMNAAVRRVCGRRHRDLVPDVEQEVRLALWKRLRGGNRIDHPASYLYKAALTTAAAVLRRHDRGGDPVEDVRLDELAVAEHGGARRLAPVECARLIEQMLDQVPDEQALALRAWLAGFNHREVARMLGWSESVARHRIYRGLETLRQRATDGERGERG